MKISKRIMKIINPQLTGRQFDALINVIYFAICFALAAGTAYLFLIALETILFGIGQ